MTDCRRRALVAAWAAADVAALAMLRDAPGQALTGVAAPHAWVVAVGTDAAVATLAAAGLWLVAAWLGLGLVCAAGTGLPGLAGAIARKVCRRLLPRVLLRLVAGAAGLGVFVAPLAAGAQPPTPPRHPSISVSAPRWPTAKPTAKPTATMPAPSWPGISRRPRAAQPDSAHEHAHDVHVAPGDSLWLLAARRLGPDAPDARIAAEWPRWYAANRAVIGDDPSVIVPGQVLRAPSVPVKETQ